MKFWEIGPSIHSLRKQKGLTQDEFAKTVGITRVTLGKLERGRLSGISLGVILTILDQFGMEIEFARTDAMPTLEDLASRDDGAGR